MVNVLNSSLVRVEQKEIPPLFKSGDPIVVFIDALDEKDELLVVYFNPYKRETGVAYIEWKKRALPLVI